MTPRLSLRSLSKRYSSTVAADAVSLDVTPGEIVALLGENGAGKSTLMKMAYGITHPDSGSIAVDGAVVEIENPKRARSLGIAMVFQQFVLFDALSVLDNVALGLPPAPMAAIQQRLLQLASRYRLPLDPSLRVHDLSVGERQRIEILRALMSTPRVLILDEPTSVLTPQAVDVLFDTLRQLAVDGVSVIFISHKLHEIRRLATRCVVMRAGKIVAEVDPRVQSETELARLMLGVEPSPPDTQRTPANEVALTVSRLSVVNSDEHCGLSNVSFEVRSGEIVGIAGVSGNGQGALMAAVSGEIRVASSSVRLFGLSVGALGTAERRQLGLRYVPEQRLGHGAVAGMSLAENVCLTSASIKAFDLLDANAARAAAQRIVERFDVKTTAPTQKVETLSGGNLQKYIVGREVLQAPRVLLINQPTWGVDAGSAASIRNELLKLRASGCAIVLLSEELDELYQLADRLLVMADGRMSPASEPHLISSAELGRWMAGSWPAHANADMTHAA
ncbi:MAG: ABC transporter ATP-binding protein [Burkholderiaceae bacterium]|nr:ABC transporter ATP-binding protein [Burkholderiaceae bacterium]